MIISKLIIKALSVNNKAYASNQLIAQLMEAIQALTETRVQCREMLQLVDNLSGQVHTGKQKAQHQRQKEYWASNLDHVAKNLTVMEMSVMQIALGNLNLNKPTKTSLLTIIEQSKAFAEHLGKVYQQIILSIAPIEAEIRREIALEQG